ncbi:PKD domain-containing protein [Taibaiella koreensis]|uniref:PKD domain-containing protein n=1 Tax=Taibaiella koreensis TaxID=1268548 RepID=UPI0013C2A97C|nr:PKD domain-containing protein [Taibaiella koreensis]
MKKWLLLSLLVTCTLFSFAQTPPYYKGTGTTTSTIPMNSTAMRSQQLYLPGDFNTLPPPGLISKIYLRNATAAPTGTFSNFNVAFLQNNLTVFPNSTFLTGAVSALSAPSFTVTGSATSGGWYEIVLPTPFPYDNTQSLVVEISYSSKTGGLTGNYTTSTNKRLYTTVSNIAATGTLSSSWSDLGLEITPAPPCVNPPTPGTALVAPSGSLCTGAGIQLSLSGNSTGSGQTYEWERSPTNTPFVPTSVAPAGTSSNLTTTVTATAWYRAKVVCGTNVPVYSAPVQVVVNPAFAGGTYTINNALPTAGANFNSFADAIAALSCGIAGPVVFNVNPATPYGETISIGTIGGASTVNTVRFNGNGATVQFANTSANRQMLTLSGSRYVTIDSINFKTLAADYGWAALITQGAAWDSITRCVFDLSGLTTTASANSSGICFSTSNTSATSTGNNGSHCYIGYNYLKGPTGAGGPYYALPVAGASDSNTFEGNRIENFYYYGVYLNGATGTRIIGNDFNRATKTSTTTFYGIYTTGTAPGTIIAGNRVHDPAAAGSAGTGSTYALYLLGDATAGNNNLVYNNAVYNLNASGIIYGIYLSSATYTKVYHNTVSIDKVLTGTSANYGMYATGTNTDVLIKNNLVNITAGSGGIKYGFYYSTAPSITDAQRNNIYVNSSQAGVQNYGYYTTAYLTRAAFQAAYPALETGSPSADPQFANPAAGDLTPGNYALFASGENLTAVVPEDILHQPRPPAPMVGAFEIPVTGINNAGTIALVTPSGSFCAGQQEVKVAITNGGSNNINTVQVYWEVNGVAQPPVTHNTLLVPLTNPAGPSIDTVTLGIAGFPAGVPATVKAWTYLPNGAGDTENGNDTLAASLQPAAFSLASNLDTICMGGNAYMSLAPGSGYQPGQLIWQSASNGTSWSDIANTDTARYVGAGLSSDVWYRVRIGGGVDYCYTDSLKISVANPQVIAAPDTGNCGPGSVALYATASANANVKWYNSPVATVPVATGSPFHTPFLSTNTSYYVAADIGSAQPQPSFVGSGTTTTSTTYSPFYASYQSQKVQYLVKASELQALGFNAGLITSIGFDVLAAATTTPLTDFTIRLKTGTFSGLTTTWETAMTPVYTNTGYVITPLAVNQFVLPTPFPWNGIDDIIVETCYQNTAPPTGTNTIRYTSGLPFTAVHYLYSNTANNCSSPGTGYTSTARPNIQFGMRSPCESGREEVVAMIYPVPDVNLGSDASICGDAEQTATLDAGNPGSSYLWDDASTAQTREIDESGTYHVTATNSFGCSQSDTVNITLLHSPVVELGNDTTICEEATLMLDAGNTGADYFWNTGADDQQLLVEEAGTYAVIVTNGDGCSVRDTITVSMSGLLPSYEGISAHNDGLLTYTFSAIEPVNVVAYRWNFGDGMPESTDPEPTHTYAGQGVYLVTLELFSSCGSIVDTQSANTVGIGKIAIGQDMVSLYPNPAQHTIHIRNQSNLVMEQVNVSSMLGQTLYETRAQSRTAHDIDLSAFAPGIYQVQIRTDKGVIVRKIEILR